MKITRHVKTQITKLFKAGKSIDQIILAVGDDYPRITATRINEVVRKHLFEQADELWSIAVKIGGRCEISGKTYNLEAHHLIKRDNLAYRWDLMNGVCLNNLQHAEADKDEEGFLALLGVFQPIRWAWYQQNENAYPNGKQVDNDELLQICKDLKEFISKGKHNANEEIGKRKRVITEADAV